MSEESMTPSDLTRIEAIREACAKVADEWIGCYHNDGIAAAIRALDLARLAPATAAEAGDETASEYAVREGLLTREQIDTMVADFQAGRPIAFAPPPAAGSREATPSAIVTVVNDVDEARLSEQRECEREAEKWKAQGDMYGWNYHMGRASGMNQMDILWQRVKIAALALARAPEPRSGEGSTP